MGLWVGNPALADSETVVWRRAANRTQSANRAVGGNLYLTNVRLLFEPNRVDAATGGQRWSAPVNAIVSVGIQPRDGNAFSGGLRNRLRLDLADGSIELFVISKLDDAVRTLREAARGHTQ